MGLVRLTKKDIADRYLNNPILIFYKDEEGNNNSVGKWYIISNTHSYMPLHLLTVEETESYEKDKESISSIKVHGIHGEGYLMWKYFDNLDTFDSWYAYGNM